MADENNQHVDSNPFESATAAVGLSQGASCEPTAMPATQEHGYFTSQSTARENMADGAGVTEESQPRAPTSEAWATFFQNMLAGFQNSNQQPSTSAGLPRKLKASEIFLPPFDPDECQFTAAQWCEEVDHHRKNNAWTDYETRNAAFTHLQGRAKKWAARTYPLCKSWEELQERLTRQFVATKRFHDLFRDMVEYKSDLAATYVEYSTNKLALIDRLETGWNESNKIEVVISGITDTQRPLAISGTYVQFGFNVQLVASDMIAKKKFANEKPQYGLAMSILVRERQVDYVQNICDGCLMTLSPITTPCCRNTFVIISAEDESLHGVKMNYGDEFLLRAENYGDPAAAPLYVRYTPAGAPSPKDRMPIQLSSLKDTNCRWTTMPLLPRDRLEGLGSPVKTGARLIIKNCIADKSLCVMNQNWMQTFFGPECGVTCRKYIDIHGRYTAENIFTLVSDVETLTKD